MIEKTVAELGTKLFIETGSNRGKTALWASALFDHVITIEADEAKYLRTKTTVTEWPKTRDPKGVRVENIHPYWGDSAIVLPHLLSEHVKEPAIFWLDAHNKTDRPPLREELIAVIQHPYDDIIYIDDAQYSWMQCYIGWPTMDEIRGYLGGYALALVSDAMIAYPAKHADLLKRIAKAERRSSFVVPKVEWGPWQ
jgi:hypothetical protein